MFQAPWGPGAKACFEGMIDSLIDYNWFQLPSLYSKHKHTARHFNAHSPPPPEDPKAPHGPPKAPKALKVQSNILHSTL